MCQLISASTLLLETRFAHLREANTLGFGPLPRLDKETPQMVEMAIDPGYGLITGTPKQGVGALWLNYLKWFRLGESLCVEVPVTQDTPAKARYGLEKEPGAATLSDEDIAFTTSFWKAIPKRSTQPIGLLFKISAT